MRKVVFVLTSTIGSISLLICDRNLASKLLNKAVAATWADDVMTDKTLTQLANICGSDKGTTHGDAHNYTALYDLIFREFKYSPISFLELGLARGGPENPGVSRLKSSYSPSVEMWLAYFPLAKIFGFDITDFSDVKHERFQFVQGDASKDDDLYRLSRSALRFNIIIDDGSHASLHQQLAFKYLYPRLAPGGLYIIEDLHWQSPVYENVVPGVPKTAEFFNSLIKDGVYMPSPILSECFIKKSLRDTMVAELFNSFNDRPSGPKNLVLRKSI